MGGVLEGYSAALRRGSESRCLSLTHCNVSTFLSGSANLAASLSNFSWQQPRKNRRGKSTRAAATLDNRRKSLALPRYFLRLAFALHLLLPLLPAVRFVTIGIVIDQLLLATPKWNRHANQKGACRPLFIAFTFRRPHAVKRTGRSVA